MPACFAGVRPGSLSCSSKLPLCSTPCSTASTSHDAAATTASDVSADPRQPAPTRMRPWKATSHARRRDNAPVSAPPSFRGSKKSSSSENMAGFQTLEITSSAQGGRMSKPGRCGGATARFTKACPTATSVTRPWISSAARSAQRRTVARRPSQPQPRRWRSRERRPLQPHVTRSRQPRFGASGGTPWPSTSGANADEFWNASRPAVPPTSTMNARSSREPCVLVGVPGGVAPRWRRPDEGRGMPSPAPP
mmetsp:Transcript_14662/g.45426  ORF Transcript_14662/g.45426 Transcript_14662/m.45426 type:complete len:250 (-) Transcript_14662:51-800(-)